MKTTLPFVISVGETAARLIGELAAMRSALARMLALAIVATMLVPAAARADGDPASDVLLAESVFYPVQPAGRHRPTEDSERRDRSREAGPTSRSRWR